MEVILLVFGWLTKDKRGVEPLILYVSVLVLLTSMYYFGVSTHYSQVANEGNAIRFTDFAYYMKNVNWFWFSDHPRIYQIGTQIRILNDWSGIENDYFFLPHLTPIALVLWMPLAWLYQTESALAHALWMGVSFTFYFAGAYRCYLALRDADFDRRLVIIFTYFFALFSFSVLLNVTTGQSSVFVCGLLVLLALALKRNASGLGAQLMLVTGLVILAFKPQYYVWGLVMTLSCKRWKEAILSVGVVSVILLLLSFRLGFCWPLEYVEILAIHSQSRPPTGVDDHILLDSMYNFRGILYPQLGYRAASFVSLSVFGIVTGAVALASLAQNLPIAKWKLWSVSPGLMGTLLIGVYLLFSPHVYTYEDILIVALVSFAAVDRSQSSSVSFATIFALFVAFAQVNAILFEGSKFKLVYWIAKFALWLYLVYECSGSHEMGDEVC